jgi:hypothetical protein
MSLRVARVYSSSSSRTSGSGVTGPLMLGLTGPKSQFAAIIDLPLGNEYISLLSVTGAKGLEDNPTVMRHRSPLVRMSSSGSHSGGSLVACQVRRNSVDVLVDNQLACRFEGDLSKLSLPKEWAVNNNRALMLGAHRAFYHVSQWRLEPVPRAVSSVNPAEVFPGGGAAGKGAAPGFGPPRQPPEGFAPQGFPPPQGFAPPQGLPPQGLPPQGNPRQGVAPQGFAPPGP